VARTEAFPHCADLMDNSSFDPATGEVHAFEAQVGSHGRLGGQSRPFLLYPAVLPGPVGELVGAEAVHRLFRDWLEELQPSGGVRRGRCECGGDSWAEVARSHVW